jgi:hypothetical protein
MIGWDIATLLWLYVELTCIFNIRSDGPDATLDRGRDTGLERETCGMAEARVGVRVAEDRQTVTLEIGPVEGPSAPVSLSLEQLTKVIKLLGQARSRMVEGSPKQPLDGKTVETIIDPPWYVQVAAIDGSLLAFDHPAYGPLGFAVPRDDVARIVHTLSAHLALPVGQQDQPS